MSYAYEMQRAFPGMKADTMVGNTDTMAAAQDIPFGAVVGRSATDTAVIPVGSTVGGVALHDQVIDALNGKYVATQAVSCFTKGRVWGRASGACTKGAPAKYDPATGLFADAGSATYPRARFRSANITVAGIEASDPTQIMVLVELDDPTIDAVA